MHRSVSVRSPLRSLVRAERIVILFANSLLNPPLWRRIRATVHPGVTAINRLCRAHVTATDLGHPLPLEVRVIRIALNGSVAFCDAASRWSAGDRCHAAYRRRSRAAIGTTRRAIYAMIERRQLPAVPHSPSRTVRAPPCYMAGQNRAHRRGSKRHGINDDRTDAAALRWITTVSGWSQFSIAETRVRFRNRRRIDGGGPGAVPPSAHARRQRQEVSPFKRSPIFVTSARANRHTLAALPLQNPS